MITHPHRLAAATLAVLGLVITGCTKPEPPPPPKPAAAAPSAPSAPAGLGPQYTAPFAALPALFELPQDPVTDAKVALGRMLYSDPRFSKSGTISCNSCHRLDAFGVDNEPTSPGHDGRRGGRNSPSSFNAAGHVAQFWDGRAATVEEQALGPVLNPIEMGMASESDVLAKIKAIPAYVEAFKAAFPAEADPVTFAHFGRAIGAFERRLVTPSRFDEYLGGKRDALTEEEQSGLKAFVDAGCIACHAGPLVGGAMYQKLGLVAPWPDASDLGRFEVTRQEADRQVFKVPSLRNVAKTGPYFHDGKVATLEDAIRLMARHQLGKELADDQVASIATFLGALTGSAPADLVAPPTLP